MNPRRTSVPTARGRSPRGPVRAAPVLMVGLLLLPSAGCPSKAAQPRGPEQVLQAFARAVAANKVERAYALMSAEFRDKHDLETFKKMVAESAVAGPDGAKILQQEPKSVRKEARLEYGDGQRLRLVEEEGSWRIADSPIEFYSQATPEEALASFVRAVERRRYDIVMRFVPDKWARSMTVDKLRQEWEGRQQAEVDRLIRSLKANLNAPIQKEGDRAYMPYGDKHEVRFVKEEGRWKIEDPD